MGKCVSITYILVMVNDYCRFTPNVSAKMYNLYQLLKKESSFIWNKEHESTFKTTKWDIVSTKVLSAFHDKLPLVLLVTDASPYHQMGYVQFYPIYLHTDDNFIILLLLLFFNFRTQLQSDRPRVFYEKYFFSLLLRSKVYINK